MSRDETIKFGEDSVSVSASSGRNGKKYALELPLFKVRAIADYICCR